MSDSVLVILILCITYVATMVINKCDLLPNRGGKYASRKEDGKK